MLDLLRLDKLCVRRLPVYIGRWCWQSHGRGRGIVVPPAAGSEPAALQAACAVRFCQARSGQWPRHAWRRGAALGGAGGGHSRNANLPSRTADAAVIEYIAGF